jgi:arabinofuranosyltransferase
MPETAIPPAERKRLQAGDGLALIALLGLVLSLSWQFRDSIIDDGYIYLRVVDNILAGHGWVFNVGERVNPCTSIPYTLLLALIRLFCRSPIATILTGFGIGLLGMSWIQYWAFREWNRALAFVIALASVWEPMLFRSVGMETTIFLACIVGSALAFQKKTQWICGILAGLAALNRPEGFALIVLMSVIQAIGKRGSFKTAQLGFLVIVIPWLVFSQLYFGSLMSNSILAKAEQVEASSMAFHTSWGMMLLHRMWIPAITLSLSVIGIGVVVSDIRKGQFYGAVVILFGLIQAVAYTILRAPFNYRWYFVPANLAINMSVILASAFLMNRLRTRFQSPSESSANLWRIGTALACLLLVSRLGAVPWEVPSSPYEKENYVMIGRWIDSHTSSGESVACVEIGYIGYYSRRPIVDMVGLIHPQALASLRNLDFSWWFKTQNPPAIVLVHTPIWLWEPSPHWGPLWNTFGQKYHRVLRIGNVSVYHRNDI